MNVRQKTAGGFSRLFLGSCLRRLAVYAWLLAVLCAPPLAQATEHEEADDWSRFNQYLWGASAQDEAPTRQPPEYEYRVGGGFIFLPIHDAFITQTSEDVNPRKNSPEGYRRIISLGISFLWKDTWGMESILLNSYVKSTKSLVPSRASIEDIDTVDELRRKMRGDFSEHFFYMLLRRFSLSPALKLDAGVGYSPFSTYELKVLERDVALYSILEYDSVDFSGNAWLVKAEMQFYFKFLNDALRKAHLSFSMGVGTQYMEPDFETKRIPDYFLDGVGTGKEVDFKPGNPIITYYISTYYGLVF